MSNDKTVTKGRAGLYIAIVAVVAVVAVAGALVARNFAQSSLSRTAPEDILVSPEWVQQRDGDVVVFDIGRSFDDYSAGHVPGAVFVDRAIIATERNGVSAMLPEADVVAADLVELGLSADTPVVVYDAGAGTWSSRLFWALEYIGHEQVHLLDGGITEWERSGGSLSTEIATPARGDFVADVRPDLLADWEYMNEHVGNEEVLVLDARSPDEYAGTDVRAARGGHIPGAVNIDWVNNRQNDGRFLPLEELTELYREVLEGHTGPAVTLCQGGFRAAHSYVALRVLGHDDARMYDGSWSEWGNREDSPIATDS